MSREMYDRAMLELNPGWVYSAIYDRVTFLEAQAAADVERMEKATALINALTAERDELKKKVEELERGPELKEPCSCPLCGELDELDSMSECDGCGKLVCEECTHEVAQSGCSDATVCDECYGD